MSLPWVRLDAGFPHNIKVLALVESKRWQAIAVYVSGLAWAGEQNTDGFIPFAALPFIHGTRRVAEHLVEVVLWEPDHKGWRIHDWEQYQPTRATRDAMSDLARERWAKVPPEKRSEAARKAAKSRWGTAW